MTDCIFCETALTSDTKPEHILPNALGGRKTTRGAICSTCNNVFGSSIDKALATQVEIIRNLLQLPSGTGKSPPGLRNVQAGADTVNFSNNGTPQITGKPFSIEHRNDGTAMVEVNARSEEELRNLLPHIAAQIGISTEDLTTHIVSANASRVSQPLGGVQHRLSFGGMDALRSITKSCLVLWSTIVGNGEVNTPPFNDVRRFVLAGDNDFNNSRIEMDSRCVPGDEDLKRRFGHLYHLLYLNSTADGRPVGHFTLYNAVSWRIVLAQSGATPETAVGLVSNPLNPAEWSDKIADEAPVDFRWLDNPEYGDFVHVQERFSAIVEQHLVRGQSHEVGRIVDDVCARRGIA
ncbi:MAG: HNH endonuclease, partial [Arenibacter algicola]|nr:HNH endonuclease [Arenibacter algicola]